MKIQTLRFGELDVAEDRFYTFPIGILGFSAVTQYGIVPEPASESFQWLQAVHVPDLALLLCSPYLFYPDYKLTSIESADLKLLELDRPEDGVIMAIVTLAPTLEEMTANLLGPLLFNPAKRLGKQIVLNSSGYPTRCPLFKKQLESIESPVDRSGSKEDS